MAIDNIRAGPIRNKDIPFLARSCLEEYGATSFPVDLLHITRGMGVKVIKDSDVHDLIPGEYGKTYHEPISGQSIIIYDDTLSLEERRFTVAHEIGHVYMKHWEEHARFMAYIEELERKHGLHVEKQADPQVGDLAVILPCSGSIQAYIKEIESIDERGIITRTRYTDPSRDFKLVAREYCGTVLKITDESGAVVWESERAHVPLSRCKRCGEYYKSGARHSCARDPFFRAYRVPPAPMSAAVCAR